MGTTSAPPQVDRRIARRALAALFAALASVLAWTGIAHRQPHYSGRSVREWIQQAASPDYREADQAQAALRTLAPQCLPALIQALRAREHWGHRLRQNLGFGLDQARSHRVPPERIRETAARELAHLGPVAHPATPELIRRLADPVPAVTQAAQAALRQIGPAAAPRLIAALDHPSAAVRRLAAELLAELDLLGPDLDPAVEALVRKLRDHDRSVRAQAAATLGAVAGRHQRPLPPSTLPVQPQSARSTGTRPSVVSALTESLGDPDGSVRAATARALGELGTAAQPATASLKNRLPDPDPGVGLEAARALWQLTGDPEPAVGHLIASLDNPTVHWQAALALGEIGPAAQTAIPALLRQLEREIAHRPSRTPPCAALALARLGPAAVAGLSELLGHANPAVRVAAVMALAGHRSAAAPAVPGLIRLLHEPDGELRIAVASALAAIGPLARDALPELEEMAQASDEYQRAAAVSARKRITMETTAHASLDPH